jgi:hypothetical protein
MKWLKNKLSGWKTTKKTLYIAIVMAVAYTTINLLLNSKTLPVDSTLTSEVFSFLKWIVATGGALSGAKIIKGTAEDNEGGEE